MKQTLAINRGSGRAALLFGAVLLILPAMAAAQSKLVDVEGMGYNVEASMMENLKALNGKQVYLTLDSGKSLAGTVKAVGSHLLHLERLSGKEHFDAIVRIDSINAVDARFRMLQR